MSEKKAEIIVRMVDQRFKSKEEDLFPPPRMKNGMFPLRAAIKERLEIRHCLNAIIPTGLILTIPNDIAIIVSPDQNFVQNNVVHIPTTTLSGKQDGRHALTVWVYKLPVIDGPPAFVSPGEIIAYGTVINRPDVAMNFHKDSIPMLSEAA